jgi:hypothetical protein
VKKLLLGSASLTLFSIAILIFQISCKKEAQAQTNTTPGLTQLNTILFEKTTTAASPTTELWTANIDGSNVKKIPIVLPAGLSIYNASRLSPDGKKVIFEARDATGMGSSLYSCAIDGSNLTKLFDGVTNQDQYYQVDGVY